MKPHMFAVEQGLGEFDIPIAQLGLLAALNFGVQFATDFVAMFFVDRIGYRAPMVWANALSAVGLAGLGVFPLLMDSTFLALCLALVGWIFRTGYKLKA